MVEIERKLQEEEQWWNRAVPVANVFDLFNEKAGLLNEVVVRGRIVATRNHKNSAFMDLQDQTGKIQLIVDKNNNNQQDQILPYGTIVGVRGTLTITKAGEPSLEINELKNFFTPNSVAIPDKSSNTIINFEKLEIIKQIAILNGNLRGILVENGFLEFQTQVLKTNHEAGTARAFATRQNSSEKEVYLRLTMETELRKLQAVGFERVFELGKSFRNEGRDKNHLPEFSLLEAYSAYTNLSKMLQIFGNLINNAVVKTSELVHISNPKLFHHWNVMNYMDIETQVMKIVDTDSSKRSVEQKIMSVIKKNIAPAIQAPTFLVYLPSKMSPFAKRLEDNQKYSQRAWAIARGKTFCDIYEDETNSDILIENLKWQDDNLARGEHISHVNNELVNLSEIGLPPSSSFGLSLNRFYAIVNGFDDVRNTELFEN